MTLIKAPWSDEQVVALNRLQSRTDIHGYTCPSHSAVKLAATTDGWFCPVVGCDYSQDWADA